MTNTNLPCTKNISSSLYYEIIFFYVSLFNRCVNNLCIDYGHFEVESYFTEFQQYDIPYLEHGIGKIYNWEVHFYKGRALKKTSIFTGCHEGLNRLKMGDKF